MPIYSKRKAGFTLLEVLVVAGVVSVLTAALVPALGRVRRSSQLTVCLNNIRQLGMATLQYASNNNDTLPFCNWDGGSLGNSYNNAQQGWLYKDSLDSSNPTEVRSGSLWPYLNNLEVYHCPVPPADSDPLRSRRIDTHLMTSYLMNGAVNSYGIQVNTGSIKYFPIHAYKPDDILFIEADERGGSAYNDGSTFPGESFNPAIPIAGGLSVHHGTVATIACFDGHAESIAFEEYSRLAAYPRKNRVWCSPGKYGHGH